MSDAIVCVEGGARHEDGDAMRLVSGVIPRRVVR